MITDASERIRYLRVYITVYRQYEGRIMLAVVVNNFVHILCTFYFSNLKTHIYFHHITVEGMVKYAN